MAGRFVRASKYRHVFGKPTKKEFCYDNLRISRNAWDTNIIKANPEYLSVNWEAGGGGAFAVIPVSEKGRLPEHIPLFRGHTAPVLDTDWNPFNDHLIASGSEDGKVFIWQVPKDFTLYIDPEESAEVEPVCKFAGHSRKVGQVLFNPAAENILASASGDYNVKLWDVASGKSYLSLKHHEIVQSLSWSANGSMLATTSRDKQLRVWDVRQENPVFSVQGHNGAKNSRVVWMGEHNRLATTGFSKMSDRQMALWDVGNPSEPIGGFSHLDSISGVCMPFWDDGTQCLFLAGKGDGNIRYFEYENDKFEFLSEYKSPEPQRGIAFVPRRGINVHENEIMRAYKTVNDTYIEPISFTVPRRAEVFQADIYPPAIGLKPALSAAEWLAGNDGIPAKIDLESIYEGNAPVEISSQFVPPTTVSGPATRVISVGTKDESHFISQKKEPMLEQKVSISAIAAKFQDDVTTSDDESSSFKNPTKPGPTTGTDDSKETRTHLPAVPPFTRATPINIEQGSQNTPHPIQSKPEEKTTSAKSDKDPSSEKDLQSSLAQIKDLLQTQIETINSQSQQIGRLAQEVDTLKAKVGSGSQEQSERIQQLERELEAART